MSDRLIELSVTDFFYNLLITDELLMKFILYLCPHDLKDSQKQLSKITNK